VDKVAKPATLLQIAKTGDTVGIKRMIDAKCSVKEATTSFGLSALHFCAIRNFADTADVILKAYCNQQYLGAEKLPEQTTSLLFAAQDGSYDTAKLLLEKRATVNKARYNGATPVIVASQSGHCDVLELLLGQGGAVNAPMQDGSIGALRCTLRL